MTGEPHCAVGVPNVGPFGDPLLLVELGPFDVILEGRTDGAASDRGAGQVAPYLEAGLTWWIEALGWWRGSPQDAMNRVRQGPPALARHQP